MNLIFCNLNNLQNYEKFRHQKSKVSILTNYYIFNIENQRYSTVMRMCF